MKILGKNLIISINGTPVAAAKSGTLNVSQDFISVCSPTERRTYRKVPTTYGWDMSVDCLVPSSVLPVSLTDMLIEGTRVLLTFTDGVGQKRAGYAYVKSCSEGGSVGSLATFNAAFEADGALYKYIQYEATVPQDAVGYELGINQDSIVFNYNSQQQEGVFVVEVKPGKPGTICLFANDVWAILGNCLQSDVLAEMYQQDTQTLEEWTTKFGNSNTTYKLDLDEQYCTIVCNVKPVVLFLYE